VFKPGEGDDHLPITILLSKFLQLLNAKDSPMD